MRHAMLMRRIVICGLPNSAIFFPHYLINDSIFEKKKFIEHKICVLIFSTTNVRNISHSQKKWARYDQICKLVFISSTRYSCPTLHKRNFLDGFLKKKNIQIKTLLNSFQWEPSCSIRTDRHDEANFRFSQFRERAKKKKCNFNKHSVWCIKFHYIWNK